MLRLFRLDQRSLWFDEAVGLSRAAADLPTAILGPAFLEPPLYYGAMHAWLGIARDDAGIRAFSAVTSAAGLVLLWRLLAAWWPPREALAGLALMALSPFEILYAHQARAYGLRFLLAMGALVALDRAASANRRGAWPAWAALLGAAGLTHTFALPLLPAAVVWLLLAGRPGAAVRAAGWGAAGALVPAVWAGWARSRLDYSLAGVSESVGPVEFLQGMTDQWGAGAWIPLRLAVPAAWLFAATSTAGVARACLRSGATGRAAGRFAPRDAALLAFGVVPPAVMYLAHAAGIATLLRVRYAYEAHPFLLMACVAGAGAVPWRAARGALLGALFAAEVTALAGYFSGAPPALDLPPVQKPFREAAARIVAAAGPGDTVLAEGLDAALPLARYLPAALAPAYVVAMAGFGETPAPWWDPPVTIRAAVARSRRVWFVVAPLRWAEPPVTPGWAARELEAVADPEEEILLPGLAVRAWRRRIVP